MPLCALGICAILVALLTDSSLPSNSSGTSRPGLNLAGLDQCDISSLAAPGALGAMPQRQPVPGSLQRQQIPAHSGGDFKVKTPVTQSDYHCMESSNPSSNPSTCIQNEETATV